MSASTRTVPAQIGWGRFPSTLAALALVVILAVAIVVAAMNGAKAAPAVDTGAKGAPPPAAIDHNYEMYSVSGGQPGSFGGFGGPRLPDAGTTNGGHNGLRIAQ